MKLPLQFFAQRILPKSVFYFSSNKINTDVSHYFICLAKNENEYLFLVCCTSDKENKRKRLAELNNTYTSLVYIKPDELNGLQKDTFVDCNTCFNDYSVNDFLTMYENNQIEYTGEISDNVYNQILKGLYESISIEPDILRNIPEPEK